jgi:hypothetical protein
MLFYKIKTMEKQENNLQVHMSFYSNNKVAKKNGEKFIKQRILSVFVELQIIYKENYLSAGNKDDKT